MNADRSLDTVITELVALQRKVGTLATDALRVTPSWRLVRFRRQTNALEERLASHLTTFMNLDADLVAYAATPSSDFNTAVRQAAWFQMYFGVRDSVRGLLADTGSTLSELRNEFVFRLSAGLSVVAILVSLAGLVFGVAV